MNRTKRIIPIALAMVLAFSSFAFAAAPQSGEIMSVGSPKLNATGNTAICECTITFSGQYIDATMELYQGSTLVASWNQTGIGRVVFSETETIVHGLTYTLTVSGTAGGVAFTPRSTTKTL